MEALVQLGELVEAQWRRHNYRESKLPQIAHDALASAALHERLSWQDLLRWCVRTPLLDSDNRTFGDVAIRVYEAPRFYVEALVWKTGQIAIHDHGFGGAFALLAGTSLHATYQFQPAEMLNEGFGVGELSPGRCEHLVTGSVRTIEAGRDFVHAVFHMAAPTVSIVVRSRVDTRALPQLLYLRAGVAFDRLALNRDALEKPLAALNVAVGLDRELFLSLAHDAILERDAHLAFEVVSRAARGVFPVESTVVSELCEMAMVQHPALANVLPRALGEQQRSIDLLKRMQRAPSSDLRTLFALLLNVPRRDDLLAIVGIDHAEPVETIIDRLRVASAAGLLPHELGTRQLRYLRDRMTSRENHSDTESVLDPSLHRLLEPLLAA